MNLSNNIFTSELALSKLEILLMSNFEKKYLLKCAFTHSSFKNENPSMYLDDNQSLEFLGDAVLGLIITDYTYDNYHNRMLFIHETLTPHKDEGKFSQFKEKHIGSLLTEIADKLGLDNYLVKSNGESNNDAGKASRLEDLMEALIGAIYKDKGYIYTKNFVLNLFRPYLKRSFFEMYEHELHALDERLKSSPNDCFLLTAKGQILHELNRFEEALKVFDEIFAIEPYFEETLAIEPHFEEVLAFKGYCLYELKKYEEGLSTVNKLINLNPKFDFIWADKGNMLLKLGRTDDALEAYKKSLELEPNDEETLYEVAKIYSLKRNKNEALFYLKKAVYIEILSAGSSDYGTFFRKNAQNETEFNWLLNDKQFREIIESN